MQQRVVDVQTLAQLAVHIGEKLRIKRRITAFASGNQLQVDGLAGKPVGNRDRQTKDAAFVDFAPALVEAKGSETGLVLPAGVKKGSWCMADQRVLHAQPFVQICRIINEQVFQAAQRLFKFA